MKKLIALLLFSFGISFCYSQTSFKTRAIIINGDTVPEMTLPICRIYGEKIFKNKRDRNKYNKLVRNVKRVYPLAKLAGQKMLEWDLALSRIPNEGSRKEYLKIAEKDIKNQFTNTVKNLSYSQGVILIKLIDRETGKTSFQIIQELRGSLQAFFWQTLAQVFGNNLKSEYDPFGEDKLVEEIVQKIENGDL